MVKKTLLANTISCGHCKMAIENGLSPVEGIKSVEVSIEDKSITVEFEEASIGLGEIVDRIEEIGYEVTK